MEMPGVPVCDPTQQRQFADGWRALCYPSKKLDARIRTTCSPGWQGARCDQPVPIKIVANSPIADQFMVLSANREAAILPLTVFVEGDEAPLLIGSRHDTSARFCYGEQYISDLFLV